MPETPDPAARTRRTLAFSGDRWIVLETAAGQPDRVRKIYLTGSMADAERELELGRRLAGAGLVAHLAAEPDPEGKRPSLLTARAAGSDLYGRVRADGPLPVAEAVAVAGRVARVLERLHGTGHVHGDVKPANVLAVPGDAHTVVLIDLEHAALVGEARSGNRGELTAGTHGYAPPEAYGDLRTAAASADVFGLGATLHWLLSGQPAFARDRSPVRAAAAVQAGAWRRRDLRALPAPIAGLVADCLAADAAARPSAATMAARCERLVADLDETAAAAAVRAWAAAARGDLAEAEAALAAAGEAAPPPLAARVLRLASWLPRLRAVSTSEAAAAAEPDGFPRRVATVSGWLRRLPAHPGLRAMAAELCLGLARQLDELPAAVAQAQRAGEFTAAADRLARVGAALDASAALGGPRMQATVGDAPTPWQRDPRRLIAATLDGLAAERVRQQRHADQLEAAEAALDPGRALTVIDAAAADLGGASAAVAQWKDRVLRFAFHLERLAQPEEQIERLRAEAETLVPGAFAAVAQLLARCRRAVAELPAAGSRPQVAGLRGLQRRIADLALDFPGAATTLAPAQSALSALLERGTATAWQTLEDCRAKLQAVPIPIRPLQNQLARLDHMLLLDIVVDRDERPRAELLDELELLRTEVDRARATRDRLASGARAAMERGHLTTALFDMARAVDQYADAPREELEAARQRKQELEAATRDNHRLAASYADMVDAPDSTVDARIALLEERRTVLHKLVGAAPEERRRLYRQDLIDVEVQLLQERADEAERSLDGQDDAQRRADVARAMRDQVVEALRRVSAEAPSGRLQRLGDHWQRLAQRERDLLDAANARRRRRRLLRAAQLAAAAALVAVVVALSLQTRGGGDPVEATARVLRGQPALPATAAGAFDVVGAFVVLDRFVGDLRRGDVDRAAAASGQGLADGCARVFAAVREVAAASGDGDDVTAVRARLQAALAPLRAARAAFRSEVGTESAAQVAEAVRRFEVAAERTAAEVMAARVEDPVQRRAAAAWIEQLGT